MNEQLIQFSSTSWFVFGFFVVQLFLLIGLALCFSRWTKNASQKHFVWMTSLAAALLLIPLQSIIPAWQISLEQHQSATQESNVGVEGFVSRPDNSSSQVASTIDSYEQDETSSLTLSDDQRLKSASVERGVRHALQSASITRATEQTRLEPSAGDFAFPWQNLLLCGYLCVACFSILRMIVGSLFVSRMQADVESGAELDVMVRNLSGEIDLQKAPQLVVTSKIDTPSAVGIWKPRVLVPVEFLDWDKSCQRIVLLHELFHLKRHDIVWELLARSATAVYWFHPALHFAASALRRTRELATDQAVLAHGVGSVEYARELLALATKTSSRRLAMNVPMAIPMSGEKDLSMRVQSVLDYRSQPVAASVRQRLLVGFLFLVVASFSFQFTLIAKSIVPQQYVADEVKDEQVAGDNFHTCLKMTKTRPPFTGQDARELPVISGVVTDPAGNPVSNAIVVLRDGAAYSAAKGKRVNCLIAKTKTDSKGRFEIESVRFRRRHTNPEIFAAAESGMIGWNQINLHQTNGAVEIEANVKLEETTPYEGRLINEKGDPVVGARLTVSSFCGRSNHPRNDLSWIGLNDRVMSPFVLSDDKGRFRFPNLCTAKVVSFTLQHPDLPYQWVSMAEQNQLISEFKNSGHFNDINKNRSEITPDGGVEITGRIVDWNGSPMQGVSVDTYRQASLTNADGTFVILAPLQIFNSKRENMEIVAQKSGEIPYSKWTFSKQEFRAGNLELQLQRPASLAGQVVSDNGKPVSGVGIHVSNSAGIHQHLKTDSEGKFSMPLINPGEVVVKLSGKKAGYEMVPDFRNLDPQRDKGMIKEFKLAAEENKVLEPFKIKRIEKVAVEVVDTNGDPVPKATVTLFSPDGSYLSYRGERNTGVTDKDGKVLILPIRKIVKPTVILCAKQEDGRCWRQAKFLAEGETNTVQFQAPRMLRGKVTVNGVRPLAGVQLHVRCAMPEHPALDRSRNRAYSFPVAVVVTDENGEYELAVPATDLAGGEPFFNVGIRKGIPNDYIAGGRSYRAERDAEDYRKDFDFQGGEKTIAGLVKDDDGKPVAGLAIYLRSQSNGIDSDRLYNPAATKTDSSGRFELTGLPDGRFLVETGSRSNDGSKEYWGDSEGTQSGNREIELQVVLKNKQ